MSLIKSNLHAVISPSGLTLAHSLAKCLSSKRRDRSNDGKDKNDKKKRNKKKDDDAASYFCQCCASPGGSGSNMYDCRKYGHSLPGHQHVPPFESLPNIPTDIFRCTSEENLGPGGQASKSGLYPNPEYFSFHHMTYYDLHLVMRVFRNCSPLTHRKPP